MFGWFSGWFSARCPLGTLEKTWAEWRMRWLADSAIRRVTLSPVLARPWLSFRRLPVNQTVHAERVVEFLQEL